MKRCIHRFSFLLFAFSFFMLVCGCAARQDETGSPGDRTGGVLRQEVQGICLDAKSGRMWQVERAGSFTSLQEAEQYAAGLQLGGHDDWRLPTRKEMFDLHYIFSWEQNGNCAMKTTGDYWTTPEAREKPLGHWETYFLCGREYQFIESTGTRGYVRAVRP